MIVLRNLGVVVFYAVLLFCCLGLSTLALCTSSKKYLYQLEFLQTPKSIEVSTDDIIGIRQKKVGVIENYFINISTNLSTNHVAKL